jgi:hypothetical protein
MSQSLLMLTQSLGLTALEPRDVGAGKGVMR